MKILLSWSSGKDSAWALHELRRDAGAHVAALLTTFNEAADRVAMHAVRRTLVEAQAAAAGLPLMTVPIPSPCPNEIYEDRMREAVARAVAEGFTHVAFGDLFLEDVRRYREERLAGTGLQPIFPLWGRPTSNEDCFVSKRDAAGRASEWETHGLICEVCLDVATQARQMHNSGASVPAIRAAIEKTYTGSHLHTPTPMPKKGTGS